MTQDERMILIQELNKLSEFEEQNIDRMKEIAHVLVMDYLHKEDNQDLVPLLKIKGKKSSE